MPDVIVLLLAASATALATGIGAIPVFLFGRRAERATPFLLGFAAEQESATPHEAPMRVATWGAVITAFGHWAPLVSLVDPP
jgi:hypothetical protein